MSEESWLQRRNPKHLLVAGLLTGVVTGAISGMFGICYVYLTPSPSELGALTQLVDVCTISSDQLFSSLVVAFGTAVPTRSLRLIQAIGILLPLFTGLLRFTTDSTAGVSSNANGLLFLGIVGLVVGGIVAAFSGIFTDTALILKISLSFVVITFFIIAGVASKMLNEMFESAEGDETVERKRQLGVVGVNLDETGAGGDEESTDDIEPVRE